MKIARAHRRRVVAGGSCAAAKGWKLPIWLRERSVMVRANEGRAGCLAQGQGPIAS